MSKPLPDFVALKERLESDDFTNGARAELRRVEDVDALSFCPALYRLYPGQKPEDRHRRIAFLLPCCKHDIKAKPLGAQLAEAKVAEARVMQVARSQSPLDLIQLRRLLTHVEPSVNWLEFGKMLWFWNDISKRKLVEDYYLAKFANVKGD